VAATFIYRKINEYTSMGFCGNAGLMAPVPVVEGLRLGLAVQNVGPGMQFDSATADTEDLPLTARVGLGYTPYKDPNNGSQLTLAVDGVYAIDSTLYPDGGAEYWLQNILALRAGYLGRPDGPSWTMGFGLKDVEPSFSVKLDYAYDYQLTALQGLGPEHRISLAFGF
jgi:hypothetical protein